MDNNPNKKMKTYSFVPESKAELKRALISRNNAISEEQIAKFYEKYGQPNDWDVSNITDMSFLLFGMANFNDPIGNWDVSKVVNMHSMFNGCSKFNQPLNSWVVDNVVSMQMMFIECTSFNQPLDKWNISNVRNMDSMFMDCTSFNQSLKSWIINKKMTVTTDMTDGSGISEENMPTFRTYMSLKDYIFVDNVDKYKRVKDVIYNQNPYKIHIETSDNREYPIVVLPKGLILYTYTNGPDLYNIQSSKTGHYHTDLKFFYPIPYYALEIGSNYTQCIAAVLTRDIRLFAAVSPSPINRSDLKNIHATTMVLTKKNEIDFYYKDKSTSTCPGFNYDPCISDELKQELNIDGYIGIAAMDSVDKIFMKNRDQIMSPDMIFNPYVVRKILGISLINTREIDIDSIPFQMNNIGEIMNNINVHFGIPEIVLNLFDNKQFANYTELLGNKIRPTTKDDATNLNMNFQQLFNCQISKVNETISDLGNKIMFTKQAPGLFHLHRDFIDMSSPYYEKYVVDNLSDFNIPDDLNYEKENGPGFEMMGYRYPSLLKDMTDDHYIRFRYGGRTTIASNIIKPVHHQMMIKQKENPNNKQSLILQETTQGIPIMMFQRDNIPNSSGGSKNKNKNKNKKNKNKKTFRKNKNKSSGGGGKKSYYKMTCRRRRCQKKKEI